MARGTRSISVDLGELRKRVDARVKSGAYANANEVLRAAVRALDREDSTVKTWMRDRIAESLNDPRPDIPAKDAFARLRRRHRRRVEAERP